MLTQFPVSYLGLMKATPGRRNAACRRRWSPQFPDLVFLPVAEALDVFAALLNSVTNAVAVIGGLAVVSGLLVLAGAMAAGRRQREADAVIMKVLGATRGDIVRAYLIEYGLLGALAAAARRRPRPGRHLGLRRAGARDRLPRRSLVIIGVIVAAVALTIAVGTATTWSALSVKPARFLREE